MKSIAVVLSLFALLSSGCAIKDFGRTIGNKVTGDYYLANENYSEGEKKFAEEVRVHPYSPTANYYYGRFLLGQDEVKKALYYFKKSSKLDPESADYLFWQGFCYGELGQGSSEALFYERTLSLQANHYLAMLYLANNRFETLRNEEALALYQRVLKKNPHELSALYNRAIIYKREGRKPEERRAWQSYLEEDSQGEYALYAAKRLLSLGDEGYMISQIAGKSVVTPMLKWKNFSAELSSEDKRTLAILLDAIPQHFAKKIEIIVYQQGNRTLAKHRALALQNYFRTERADIATGASWFSSAYFTTIENKKVYRQSMTVFFTTNK